eukprot:Gb_20369 [translate_table: standard]
MLTEVNQEKIVEAGGLASLLILLETSEDETIQRVAAGAIANLAMNGVKFCLHFNHELLRCQVEPCGKAPFLAQFIYANEALSPSWLSLVSTFLTPSGSALKWRSLLTAFD